ncbi:MAG: HAMP domain-containing sensor histidine kinase [Deinococcales bacterium]
MRSFAWSLPIGLCLTALLVMWLTRRLLKPLEKLSQATEELRRESFPEAIEVPEGDDEISHLAASFNEMVLALQKALDRERSFTRYASHELRTPLSTIQAQTEALELDLLPKERIIQQLKYASNSMQQILQALLSLSRHQQSELSPIKLAKIIKELKNTVKDQSRLNFANIDPQITVQAHQGLLSQALKICLIMP